jgi:hypothetical protein
MQSKKYKENEMKNNISIGTIFLLTCALLSVSCNKEEEIKPQYDYPSSPKYGQFIETIDTPYLSGNLCFDNTVATITGRFGLYGGIRGGGYKYAGSYVYTTNMYDDNITPRLVDVNLTRKEWAPVKGWICDQTFSISAEDENGFYLPISVDGCSFELSQPKLSGYIDLKIKAKVKDYESGMQIEEELRISCD